MFVQIEKRAAEIQTSLFYDPDDDIRKSVKVGFDAIKERISQGGSKWPSDKSDID